MDPSTIFMVSAYLHIMLLLNCLSPYLGCL